jgi:hypothetical protein
MIRYFITFAVSYHLASHNVFLSKYTISFTVYEADGEILLPLISSHVSEPFLITRADPGIACDTNSDMACQVCLGESGRCTKAVT